MPYAFFVDTLRVEATPKKSAPTEARKRAPLSRDVGALESARQRWKMKPLGYSVSTFLMASVLSLGPVALLVLLPNSWWGIIIKCISALLLLGVAGKFLRDFPAKRFIYGPSVPGFIINIPLFALALWLDPGILKTVFAFLFLFVAMTNFLMIYNNAKARQGNVPQEL